MPAGFPGQIASGAIDSLSVPLSPSIEDKYEVLAKISEGGMGAVYKVRHRLLDEVRVIKVVLPHAGPASELRDRFLGEARAASRLTHPNIARILDFLVDEEGQQLLVLEHIDGPTLREALDRSGPPPQFVGPTHCYDDLPGCYGVLVVVFDH